MHDTPSVYSSYCFYCFRLLHLLTTLLIKTTAAQIEVALSYHRVRGLYFLAVVLTAIIS